jgi:hypothetical protein
MNEQQAPKITEEFKNFLRNDCDVQDLLALLEEAKITNDNSLLLAIHEILKERSIPKNLVY